MSSEVPIVAVINLLITHYESPAAHMYPVIEPIQIADYNFALTKQFQSTEEEQYYLNI